MLTKIICLLLPLALLVPGMTVYEFCKAEAQITSEVTERDPVRVACSEPSVGVGRIKKPIYNLTEEEKETVSRLVYLEARGESVECIRAVVEVIFNRLSSGIWGETIDDVIYADGQFDPARFIDVSGSTEQIREIVDDVCENGCKTIPEHVLYFRDGCYHNFYGAMDEFQIGNMFFSSSVWNEV